MESFEKSYEIIRFITFGEKTKSIHINEFFFQKQLHIHRKGDVWAPEFNLYTNMKVEQNEQEIKY